jgi:beta-N-acetylhexosaminidase
MINLKGKPFYLDGEAIEWVNNTRDGMTDDEKVGQLFMLESVSGDPEDLNNYFEKIQPGGFMHRPNPCKILQKAATELQAKSKIPLLVAGNLGSGGNDVAIDGQPYATPMGVGATGNTDYAYKQGVMCGETGKIIGVNWTFAPVSDINCNFMNSAIQTRSYGDDPDKVSEMAAAFIKGVQSVGVAACFKHFPGDGIDFRDQHVTPSVNSLNCKEWDESFGKIYKKAIEAGALTCMVGHITQPAYSMKLDPSLTYDKCLPASLSKELMTGMLREKLGFNGMIVTDATQMAGMSAQIKRDEAVPLAIEAGADMFLFYRDFDEDIDYMRQGLKSGKLSSQRLDEAVTRILATKAALKLHKGIPHMGDAKTMCKPEYIQWAQNIADDSITLAKNLRSDLFPITPDRYKNVILYSHVSENIDAPVMRPEAEKIVMGNKQELFEYFVLKMQEEGFNVTVYSEEMAVEKKLNAYHSKEAIKQYDISIHFANVQKEHGRAPRILYNGHCANDAADTDMYIPTVLISMTSPYLLADAPRVKTCINCYTPEKHVVDALLNKLTGRSPFKGKSPVDQFCGLEDTKF